MNEQMKDEIVSIKSDLSLFHKLYHQNQSAASSGVSFKYIIQREKKVIKEPGNSSPPSSFAPALKSHEDKGLQQPESVNSFVEYIQREKIDNESLFGSNGDTSGSHQENQDPNNLPTSQVQLFPPFQCEELAGIPVTPPPKQHTHIQTNGTRKLQVDNKKLSLAVSGQGLQVIEESQAKDFFINHFNKFIGPFNSGLNRDFISSDITHIQKNPAESSFYLRFSSADLRDAVFLNKFCLSSEAVGDCKLYLHSFLSEKEKRHQARLLKEFYSLSTKTDGKYSFRFIL